MSQHSNFNGTKALETLHKNSRKNCYENHECLLCVLEISNEVLSVPVLHSSIYINRWSIHPLERWLFVSLMLRQYGFDLQPFWKSIFVFFFPKWLASNAASSCAPARAIGASHWLWSTVLHPVCACHMAYAIQCTVLMYSSPSWLISNLEFELDGSWDVVISLWKSRPLNKRRIKARALLFYHLQGLSTSLFGLKAN